MITHFRKLLISLSVMFTWLFDAFILFLFQANKPGTEKQVLIIRLDAIGDFVLWLDAAKEFRQLYPQKKISLIANQAWASLAKSLPYWDEIQSVDRKKLLRHPFYRWNILLRLRREGFETVIQPTFSREFRLGDSLVRASGAMIRIGSMGDSSNITTWQKRISDRWYSKLLPATGDPLMEIQRNAEFMMGLGLHNYIAGMPSLTKSMDLPPKLTITRPYFVIVPGAFRLWRIWPVAGFSALLSKLTVSNSGFAVLCGSHEERDLCSRVIKESGKEALNLAGETSLPELVEVIRRAKFLVGNESAAVHIAAAVGTPSVCIVGGGHYGRFMPYVLGAGDHYAPVPVIHRMDCFNCNWQCTQPHAKGQAVPCISHITVDQVMKTIDEIHNKTISIG